jgi:hypothetical protein
MIQDIQQGFPPAISANKAAENSFFRLLYNYLRLSPTYAVGQSGKGLINTPNLCLHGKKVIACASKYQDVHKTSFLDWMNGAGSVCLSEPSQLPEFQTAMDLKAGHPSDLFVRFPMGRNVMPQLELLAMIAAVVPSVSREKGAKRLTKALEKNLWRHVYLVYLSKNFPEIEKWRIGAEAMLVGRYIGKVDPLGPRMKSNQDFERKLLSNTAKKHLEWASRYSEHAAIDEFPCKKGTLIAPTCFDHHSIDLDLQLRNHSFEEAMNARAKIIDFTDSVGKVPMDSSFKEQGLLF